MVVTVQNLKMYSNSNELLEYTDKRQTTQCTPATRQDKFARRQTKRLTNCSNENIRFNKKKDMCHNGKKGINRNATHFQ